MEIHNFLSIYFVSIIYFKFIYQIIFLYNFNPKKLIGWQKIIEKAENYHNEWNHIEETEYKNYIRFKRLIHSHPNQSIITVLEYMKRFNTAFTFDFYENHESFILLDEVDEFDSTRFILRLMLVDQPIKSATTVKLNKQEIIDQINAKINKIKDENKYEDEEELEEYEDKDELEREYELESDRELEREYELESDRELERESEYELEEYELESDNDSE